METPDQQFFSQVLDAFCDRLVLSFESLIGLDLEVNALPAIEGLAESHRDEVTALLDFNGSVMGYLSMSCSLETMAKLAEVSTQNVVELKEEGGPLFKEVLNTVGGYVMPVLKTRYELLTLMSPRLFFGLVDFPHTKCWHRFVETAYGPICMSFATDHMGLEVIELLKTVQKQKKDIEKSRTEIKEITDNIELILLKIDQEGLVMPGTSLLAQTVFNLKEDEQIRFVDRIAVLLSEQVKADFELWTLSCFTMYDRLGWNKLCDLCPITELVISERTYHIHFEPIVYDDELLKILVLGKDVSDIVRLESEIVREREDRDVETDMLRKLLEAAPSEAQGFLKETYSQLERLKECLLGKEISSDQLNSAKSCTHMLKGSSGLFQMGTIAELAHELESVLVAYSKGEAERSSILKHLNFLSTPVQKVFDWGKRLKLLGIQESESSYLWVDQKELKRVYGELLNVNPASVSPGHLARWRDFFQNQLTAPCAEIFERLNHVADSAANKLNLQGPTIVHLGGETKIFTDYADLLMPLLTHMVRNAVSHSLESETERKQQNKNVVGEIILDYSLKNHQLEIKVMDDGRGFDFERIFSKARQFGIVLKESQDLNALLDVLTVQDFSTAEQVTEVSGCGIGLSLVKRRLELMGGSLFLEQINPTQIAFVLSLPCHV